MPSTSVAERVRRSHLGFPKGFGKRLETLINRGLVDPWQALAFAVVVRAVHVDGVEWLGPREGEDWATTAGFDPAALRRAMR